MADMYGRLTGRAGVCLGTLGPGRDEPRHRDRRRLPRPRAARRPDRPGRPRADAQGDPPVHRPRRALAADHEVERARHEPGDHPRGRPQGLQGRRVREARRDAPRAARGRHGAPSSTRSRCRAAGRCIPEPGARELLKAADLIRNAINPVVLAGNGVVRAGAAPALREFTRATGIPVAETFMGKGVLDYEDPRALGTVGLQARDYAMAGFEDADVVIAIGYDLVEHSPEHWNPKARQEDRRHRLAAGGDRRVLHARGRARRRHLPRALPAGRGVPRRPALGRLHAPARRRSRPPRGRQGRRQLPDAAAARAVGDPPGAAAARTSSSPTSACTSCGSGGCSRPTSPTP